MHAPPRSRHALFPYPHPQAIHYASYDSAGHSYRDWQVADRIRAHNTFVNGESRHRRLRSA
jgi:hypothetical protein